MGAEGINVVSHQNVALNIAIVEEYGCKRGLQSVIWVLCKPEYQF